MSYDLNIPKAMLKKLLASEHEFPVTLNGTDGGLRIFCQVGYYELFRFALNKLFKNLVLLGALDMSMHLHILAHVNTDQRKNQVSCIYKVAHDINGAKQKLYTINLFHTTSTMLINGNREDMFLNTHLTKINDLIAASMPSETYLSNMNVLLAKTIKAWFANQNVGNNWLQDNVCPLCTTQIESDNFVTCGDCSATFHPTCVEAKGRGRARKYTCCTCLHPQTLAITTQTTTDDSSYQENTKKLTKPFLASACDLTHVQEDLGDTEYDFEPRVVQEKANDSHNTADGSYDK